MLVPFILYLFVIAWKWITLRLKTKKHTTIRICVSFLLLIFNLIAIIVCLADRYMKENDYSIFLGVLIFYMFFFVLWGIRLYTDLVFIFKKNFKEKEDELCNIIKEKLNIKKIIFIW